MNMLSAGGRRNKQSRELADGTDTEIPAVMERRHTCPFFFLSKILKLYFSHSN